MAALLAGSTLKLSAMHDCAISMDSWSPGASVPSLSEADRKSMMARAKRFLVSADADGEAYGRCQQQQQQQQQKKQ
jgi:hypothetical protein